MSARAHRGANARALALLALCAACRDEQHYLTRGAESVVACHTADDCQDGFVCNGEEQCEQGRCAAGEAPFCDDGDRCTLDGCNEPLGCTHVLASTARCAADAGVHDAAAPLDAGARDAQTDAEAGLRLPPSDEARAPEIACPTSVGSISADDNATLERYRGVACVAGTVRLSAKVSDLSALAQLRRAGSLLYEGPSDRLLQLAALERVDSDVQLTDSQDSGDLVLPSLRWIGRSLLVGRVISRASPFPALRYVGAMLVLTRPPQGAAPTAVTLPELRAIGDSIELGVGSMRTLPLTLPRLETLGGSLQIVADDNPPPVLDALREAGQIVVVGSRFAGRLSLPSLTRALLLRVVGNPRLSGLDLPKLSAADTLEIRLNPLLSRCEVEAISDAVSAQLLSPPALCCNRGCERCSGTTCATEGSATAGQSSSLAGLDRSLSLPVAAFATVEQADRLGFSASYDQPLPASMALREATFLSFDGIEGWSSLQAFSALRSVGTLVVRNTTLTSLRGLEGVQRIVDLSILDNTMLTDVSAFDPDAGALRSLSGNVQIQGNIALPPCEAERLGRALDALTDGGVTVARNSTCSEAGVDAGGLDASGLDASSLAGEAGAETGP